MSNNLTQPSAVAERIDLRGGIYIAKGKTTEWYMIFPNKGWFKFEASTSMVQEFAAAMRAEPAAQVTLSDNVRMIKEIRVQTGCGLKQAKDAWVKHHSLSKAIDEVQGQSRAEPTTPPGDVAMQAARTPEVDKALDVAGLCCPEFIATIEAYIAQLEAAQAPAACQSDEDVAREIGAKLFGKTLIVHAVEVIAAIIARHRQAYEAAAWRKGCEYMREAAADFVEVEPDEKAFWRRDAIRALEIPLYNGAKSVK